ncbi:hypothetical protein PFISCL1PPCAC_79, partial [Pristionchus fissidentatus]
DETSLRPLRFHRHRSIGCTRRRQKGGQEGRKVRKGRKTRASHRRKEEEERFQQGECSRQKGQESRRRRRYRELNFWRREYSTVIRKITLYSKNIR